MMDNFICGGYVFSSNFDSGNLNKVELVHWNGEAVPNNESVAVELNLWTRPDCAGTEYENLNRSWFFFSIQGGDINKVCKLNIVNLNKQAKLFSQGMHPVIRIGDTGKWERMKESPVYDAQNGDFVLSFLHKPGSNIATKYFYAFTFPFTYTECQNQLTHYDILYEKSDAELEYISQRLSSSTEPNRKFNKNDTNGVENEQNLMNEIPQNLKSTSNINILENQSNTELENNIYYRRELLTNSLEGRRIDLLTITSFHNIQIEREYRFSDLFPESNTQRCNLFKNKKIIFISSRVHPGETPASFMLNGFLKMILDRKNRYANILRKMYVFKIIPLLNPDGVCNGYYRSDTLGHNLNRVYLLPSKETQPSIYAVHKLIRYYHDEKNIDENEAIPSTIPMFDEMQQIDIANNNNSQVINFEMDGMSPKTDSESSNRESPDTSPRSNVLTERNVNAEENRHFNVNNKSTLPSQPLLNIDALDARSQSSLSEFSPIPSTSSTTPSMQSTQNESLDEEEETEPKPGCSTFPSSHSSCDEAINKTQIKLPETNNNTIVGHPKTVFNNHFMVEIKPSMSTENVISKCAMNDTMPAIDQTEYGDSETNGNCTDNNRSWNSIEVETPIPNKIKVNRLSLKLPKQSSINPMKEKVTSQMTNVPIPKITIQKDSPRIVRKKDIRQCVLKPNLNGNGNGNGNGNEPNNKSSPRFLKKKMTLTPGTSGNVSSRCSTSRLSSQRKSIKSNTDSVNISADFCDETNANGEDSSNMFLYIDLHGHASKKGVFMYGNYLPKPNEAVECMLLPRLMSLNCNHFHFDACVFSERNMYHKGKRDGLSKEGSGRVAIYKTIGLIKCYTLEGNYNSGKYVNVLSPRGKESNVRRICTNPPKYTPSIFEEVGKALGPSILDLTDSNPMSRLRNSEFRSLHGLRNSLRNDIERGSIRSESLAKATTSYPKLKSSKPSTACCSSLTDVCKENKRYTTNKPQISYGKKEKPANVSTARKKVNASVPLIPTKRLKVIAEKKFATINQTETKELEPTFNRDDGISSTNVSTNAVDETVATDVIGTKINISSAAFDPCCSYLSSEHESNNSNKNIEHFDGVENEINEMKIMKSESTTSEWNSCHLNVISNVGLLSTQLPAQSSSAPCASTSLNSFKYPNVTNKPTNFPTRKSTAGGSISAIKLRSTFSGTGIESRSLRKSTLTKDGRRMRKKKKDTGGLKRKKSKVF